MEVENLSSELLANLDMILADNIKVVSFDIFDTLLLRPVMNPGDIWSLVGKINNVTSFSEKRRVAEKEARRLLDYPAEDCTLENIYDRYSQMFNCTSEVANELLNLELEIEHKMLYPRKSLQYIYNRVLSAGKEIIITSDMYLSASFLEKVLKKNGYSNYTKLYVSSEEKLTKDSGNLYRRIIGEYARKGIAPHEILHIGDNIKSDVIRASELQLKTVHIRRTIDLFNKRKKFDSYHNQNLIESQNTFLVAMLANYLFDDPYTNFGSSYFNGDPFFLGYTIAPLLISYKLSKKESPIKYIPYQVHNLLQFDNVFTPILILNKLDIIAFANVENGLIDSLICIPYNPTMSIKEFISQRIFVDNEKDIEEIKHIFMKNGYLSINENVGKLDNIAHLAYELEPFFRIRAAKIKSSYSNFIPENFTLTSTEEDFKLSKSKSKYSEELTKVQSKMRAFCKLFNDLFDEYLPHIEFDVDQFHKIALNAIGSRDSIDVPLLGKLDLLFGDQTVNGEIRGEWHEKLRVKGYHFAEKLRILEPARKLYHCFSRQLPAHIEIKNQVNASLEILKKSSVDEQTNTVMFIGEMHLASYKVLNTIAEEMKAFKWIYFTSNYTLRKKKLNFPILPTPNLFAWGRFPSNFKVENSERYKNRVQKDVVLQQTIERILECYPKTTRKYLEFLVCEIYDYFEEVVKHINPKLLLIWNRYRSPNCIVESIANKLKIPVVYMESGVLPGTVFMDREGMIGESWVAYDSEKFSKLAVSEAELNSAANLISYFKKANVNRYFQSTSGNFSDILGNIDRTKPIIFFAGDCDSDSGVYPFNQHVRKYHSPIFTSSYEAVLFLANIAKDNGWNLIYKPHPIMINWYDANSLKLPKNVTFVADGDINDLIDVSDVTLGITTSVAYSALFRDKPVVMLGYNHLRGKGVTYEAFSAESVFETVKTALKHGYVQVQKQNFVKHIAQLEKYYLFDNLTERPIRYGRPVKVAAKFLENLILGKEGEIK